MKIREEFRKTLLKRYRYAREPWTSSLGITYIGHNEPYSKELGEFMTRAKAKKIFQKRVQTIERSISRELGREIPQEHFEIMVALCYDIGLKAFKNSLFFNFYRIGEYEESFNNYMTWSEYKGKYSQSLYNRRREELNYIGF